MGGTVAGLWGSWTIEGTAAGGGVQVEGRTSDMIIFDAPIVPDIGGLGEGASPCLCPLEFPSHPSTSGEADEEPIGTELGMLILVTVRITRGPCCEEGADSESKRIGVLDLSNSLNRLSVFIAPDGRGGGGRLRKEFCLDSSSLGLREFNCPEGEYSMEAEVVLHNEGSVLKRLGLWWVGTGKRVGKAADGSGWELVGRAHGRADATAGDITGIAMVEPAVA